MGGGGGGRIVVLAMRRGYGHVRPASSAGATQDRERRFLQGLPGAHMLIVEDFKSRTPYIGRINSAIPDDLKAAFNKAFACENKSAVVTRLMIPAIEAE